MARRNRDLVQILDEHERAIRRLKQALARAGGGAAPAFGDLTDVTITSPATGGLIYYNGSAWVDGDHGNLAGLSDNDHPQYALLTGDGDADFTGGVKMKSDSNLGQVRLNKTALATKAAIFYNDGNDLYFLISDTEDGTWNALRPFRITLATGAVSISEDLTTQQILPLADDAYNFGSTALRWSTGYFNSIDIFNDAGWGSIELKGISGGFLDFAKLEATDYDVRLISIGANQLRLDGGEFYCQNGVFLGANGTISNTMYGFATSRSTGLYSYSTGQPALSAAGVLVFRSNNSETRIPKGYTQTGSDPSLGITSTGFLRRITSSRRYKTDINYDLDRFDLLGMRLQPVHYYREDHGGDEENSDGGREFFGLIAEDVADLHPSLAFYDNATNLVENFHHDGVFAIIVAQLNDARDRLIAQDARIERLEAALHRLNK
jgi:hypothetical protein